MKGSKNSVANICSLDHLVGLPGWRVSGWVWLKVNAVSPHSTCIGSCNYSKMTYNKIKFTIGYLILETKVKFLRHLINIITTQCWMNQCYSRTCSTELWGVSPLGDIVGCPSSILLTCPLPNDAQISAQVSTIPPSSPYPSKKSDLPEVTNRSSIPLVSH